MPCCFCCHVDLTSIRFHLLFISRFFPCKPRQPLARDPNAADTQSISRDHVIEQSRTGLITIAGGKWTTYRKMAEDTVDRIASRAPSSSPSSLSLSARSATIANAGPCVSARVQLLGAAGWSLASPSSLERLGLPTPIAQHLADSYGDKAAAVAAIAAASSAAGNTSSASSGGGDGASSADVELGPLARPLARGFPFIEAEVVYAARHEYAQTAIDVLARRTRLAFLHRGAAERALPRVIELMGAELGWSAQRRADEAARARVFLRTMGHEGRGSGSGSADGVSGEDSAADDFDGAVSNRGWSRLCMHVHSVCTIFSRQSILSCLCLNTQ